MSAIEYSRYELVCDGPGHPKAKFFRPYISDGVRVIQRGRVRRLAGIAGWTHVQSDSGRKYDKDFCPEHKAEAQEAIAQRARRHALRRPS